MSAFDPNKYINMAVKKGDDFSKPQTSSSYTPPPTGMAIARLVGYVELGKQQSSWAGNTFVKDKVELIFELFGKKYPAKEFNGEKVPVRISIHETLSNHQKSNFYKIFKSMAGNSDEYSHGSQFLGKPFVVEVFHKKSKDGKVYATLKGPDGYNIKQPIMEDPVTGETREIKVPEPISQLRLFIWDFADEVMWNSIYIDGAYANGKSKNVLQEQIKLATNFKGSPVYNALQAGGNAVMDAADIVLHAPADGDDFGDLDDFDSQPVQQPARQATRPTDITSRSKSRFSRPHPNTQAAAKKDDDPFNFEDDDSLDW